MGKIISSDRIRRLARLGWVINIVYSIFYVLFGIGVRSWWMFTIGVYYGILSAVRIVVLRSKSKGRFLKRFSGIMLMLLSLPICGTVILALVEERGTVFPLVVMLIIAIYAFTKISLAIVNLIRVRHGVTDRHTALRHISFADALVSIFSLQRSMLVSFEGMTATEIMIMNAVIGMAVCAVVFALGLHLLIKRK